MNICKGTPARFSLIQVQTRWIHQMCSLHSVQAISFIYFNMHLCEYCTSFCTHVTPTWMYVHCLHRCIWPFAHVHGKGHIVSIDSPQPHPTLRISFWLHYSADRSWLLLRAVAFWLDKSCELSSPNQCKGLTAGPYPNAQRGADACQYRKVVPGCLYPRA